MAAEPSRPAQLITGLRQSGTVSERTPKNAERSVLLGIYVVSFSESAAAESLRFGFSWGNMKPLAAIVVATCVCSLWAGQAIAEDKDPRPAAGVQDNSCLVEEAYNQEAGVVQHIGCLRRQGRDWFFNFTQEWPIGSQAHQFSYTLPYTWLRGEGQKAQGIGDVLLNYRYQAIYESAAAPAFAPRFSAILPTGSWEKGTGNGSYGYQLLLPVSKIVSDRVTLHANAGVTSYFDVQGRKPTSYLVGASVIYAVTRDFNLMLESLHEWSETVNETREIEREKAFTISPGARYGFNLPAGQLVVGASLPIRLVKGTSPDYGIMLYTSFEHNFLK